MYALLTPRQLSPDEPLAPFTEKWLDLMAPSADKKSREEQLRACLSGSGSGVADSRLNYVYLPGNLVHDLLKTTSSARWVRTYFALTDRDFVTGPGGSDSTPGPIFTTIIVLADKDGTDILPYYQAGVTTQAEVYIDEQTPLRARVKAGQDVGQGRIPLPLAEQRICAWNILEDQQELFPLFLSEASTDSPPLRSYLFEISDFQDAWADADPAQDAIWLNFDLCSRDSELGEALTRFSTTVTVDSNPIEQSQARITLSTAEFYGDLSRPCPPACLIYSEVSAG